MRDNTGIVIPLIFLIIIPFSAIALTLLPHVILSYFLSNGLFLMGVKTSEFFYIGEIYYISHFGDYISVSAVTAVYISVAYGIYPVSFSMEKYSRKKGNENIVMESQFIE